VVAGDTLQDRGHAKKALECAVSPVTRGERGFGGLRMLQRMMGSVPLVHVDVVCDALVFCMERPSIAGRFLCAQPRARRSTRSLVISLASTVHRCF
jgi:hypothetical protein